MKNNNISAKKPKMTWYLLPIILGLLGGIIGWIILRNRDKKMARNVLFVGIGTFILGIIIIAAMPFKNYKAPDASSTPVLTPTPVTSTPVLTPTPVTSPPVLTPTPVTAPIEPIIKVRAPMLYLNYTGNKIAADAKYKNKVIQVTGHVGSVDEMTITHNPYVNLITGSLITGLYEENVMCEFDEEKKNQLIPLKRGQKVTIQGRCDGYSLGTVHIRDCILIET